MPAVRQGNADGAARAVSFAVGFDVAVVCFDECFGDREADAGATMLAVAGGVDPVEAIKQPGKVLRGYAVAGVGDGDDEFVVVVEGGDVDVSACARVT